MAIKQKFSEYGLQKRTTVIDEDACSLAVRAKAYSFGLDIAGTATRTVPLFRATRKGTLKAATWVQELDADGTKTVTIRNRTKALNMTSALDIAALPAQASAAFALTANTAIDAGDQIELVYTVTVAGVTAPGACGVTMEVQHEEAAGRALDE